MTSKVGSFDWIVDYETIKSFLDPSFTQITIDKGHQIVANIGCGTSSFSQDLTNDGYQYIDGLDNDDECVLFMRNQCKHNTNLSWYHYDLVNQTGNDALYFHNHCRNRYDLIIDKGTFDAILVEGSCSSMLKEVMRLLKPITGVYLIFSINKKELLESLFTLPILRLDCCFYDMQPPLLTSTLSFPLSSISEIECTEGFGSNGKNHIQYVADSNNYGTVVVARKRSTNNNSNISNSNSNNSNNIRDSDDEDEIEIDLELLCIEEERVMNAYFQSINPLLTPERETIIREKLLLKYNLISSNNNNNSTSSNSPTPSSLNNINNNISSNKSVDDSVVMVQSDETLKATQHPSPQYQLFSAQLVYKIVFEEVLDMSEDYSYDLFLEDLLVWKETTSTSILITAISSNTANTATLLSLPSASLAVRTAPEVASVFSSASIGLNNNSNNRNDDEDGLASFTLIQLTADEIMDFLKTKQ